MNNPASTESPVLSPAAMRRKVFVDFGLFTIFFLFYIGAAVVQTPFAKDIAKALVVGIPFGLLMSLAIFPVSWLLIIIWFWKAR